MHVVEEAAFIPAAAAVPAQEGQPHGTAVDIIHILRQRWPVVAVTTIVVLLLAGFYLAAAPRLYTGVATVLLDPRNRPAIEDPNAAVLNAYPDALLVESQIRVIASEAVLRRVVETEHLADDPDFAPSGPGLVTRLLVALGVAKPADPPDSAGKAAAALARHIKVKRSERTYVVDVEATAREPALAARLANAVVRSYFDDQQAARAEAATRDGEWVLGQVKALQADLQAADERAAAFRREHGIIDINGKLLNEQNLAEASTGLVQARTRAADAKARFEQIERVVQSGRNADTLPDALRSPAMDKLRGQYNDISRQQATLRQTLGARHPALLEADQQMRDVKRLIGDELNRIEAGVANEYQTAQAGVAAMDAQVQSFKGTAATSSADRVKLAELERDIDARRAVLDRFLRARDTVKEQASDAPIGRTIAPATIPTAPSSPRTAAVLAVAAASGLLVGIGLALLGHTLGWRTLRWPAAAARAREQMSGSPVTGSPHPHADHQSMYPAMHGAATFSAPAATLASGSSQALCAVSALPDDPAREKGGQDVRPSDEEPETPVVATFSVPSPIGARALIETRPRLVERLRALWPTVDMPAVASDPAFQAAIAALPVDFAAREGKAVTLLVTSLPGSEARSTLALGLAARAAAMGLRAIVIDAEGGRSLLRDLIEPGAQADLLELAGTTRMCYRVATPGGEPVAVVPKVGDQARAIGRMRGRSGIRHIHGLRDHFDVVLFDGPCLSDRDGVRASALSAQGIVLVATPGADQAVLRTMTTDPALPPAIPVTVVLAAPVMTASATPVAA